MAYTIKQVSEMMSLPVSTIRYYDKMGLIPFLEKNESGYVSLKKKIFLCCVLLNVSKIQV